MRDAVSINTRLTMVNLFTLTTKAGVRRDPYLITTDGLHQLQTKIIYIYIYIYLVVANWVARHNSPNRMSLTRQNAQGQNSPTRIMAK